MGDEELGTTLRELRRERGLSQQTLADRAGVSRNFVAQIERGESTPTVSLLARIAQALGATVGELLGENVAEQATDTVPVPVVADAIAAGTPLFMADQVEHYEHLPYSLIRNLRANPRQVVLVRIGKDQDSMADTIPPGSEVLIDRTPVREIAPRGIYAVREEVSGDLGCSVKRLVLDEDARVLILLSDNPSHLPRAVRLKAGQALTDVVIGRVVWWMPPIPASVR